MFILGTIVLDHKSLSGNAHCLNMSPICLNEPQSQPMRAQKGSTDPEVDNSIILYEWSMFRIFPSFETKKWFAVKDEWPTV